MGDLAYLRVAAGLRDSILSSTHRAGTPLPTEMALCAKFKVSRSTVREALRILASEHLIVTRRGVRGGNRIARVDHPEIRRMLVTAITMLSRSDTITVGEILEARELFEVPAAGIAAVRRSPEHLTQLRSFISEPDELSARKIYRANSAFHKTILEATTNRLLHTMTEPLFAALEDRFARELASRVFWRTVVADHREILAAIEARDAKGARATMTAHLLRLRGTYEELDRLAAARGGPRPRRSRAIRANALRVRR